jgi:hypothetical protein
MKQSISCPERGNKGNLTTSHEADKKERLPYPHAASHHIPKKKREKRNQETGMRRSRNHHLGVEVVDGDAGSSHGGGSTKKRERERFSSKQR